MTTKELKQYKKDYNARIAEFNKQYHIKSEMMVNIKNEQQEIMTKMFDLVDEHEKVCEEFDREKE